MSADRNRTKEINHTAQPELKDLQTIERLRSTQKQSGIQSPHRTENRIDHIEETKQRSDKHSTAKKEIPEYESGSEDAVLTERNNKVDVGTANQQVVEEAPTQEEINTSYSNPRESSHEASEAEQTGGTDLQAN